MNYLYLSCTALLFAIFSCAQPPEEKRLRTNRYEHQLGDRVMVVNRSSYGQERDFVFVKLHDNEQTAGQAALQLMQERGGALLAIENEGERLIDFSVEGRAFRFDPNRIFSPEGRTNTLKFFQKSDEQAVAELEDFAGFLLRLIPGQAFVVAVHNNTNGEYVIYDYEGQLKKDAAAVFINPGMDPDDFVFTTDSACFDYLRSRNINAVLQHNGQVTNDGSLSYYYGQRGLNYANVEAEFGHLDEQLRMTRAVLDFLALK